MKILKLSAENIKRLSVVEITPDGAPLQVIGGVNGAGKSSVLDAIEMALGGASSVPSTPVRNGQARGKVVLDLGEFIVTRTFTAGGGTALVVSSKDGRSKFSSPQALLDKLVGTLSFDPLAFERMDAKQQDACLRDLVGLSTDDLDSKIASTYTDRTQVNRAVKQLESQVATLHAYPEAPVEEVSIAALSGELEAADASRRVLERARAKYDAAVRDHKDAVDGLTAFDGQRETLLAQLAAVDAHLEQARRVASEKAGAVEDTKTAGLAAKSAVIEAAPIRERLVAAESINQQVRANVAKVEADSALAEERKQAQLLTDRLAALEDQKRARLAAVTMPVAGLTFAPSGLLFDGVPFEQASQAQRLRVSVAVGLALNPQLKVLLVREGSALDRKSLALLGELAAEADAQIWVEMVKEAPGEGVSVFIEDGTVRLEPVGVGQ